MLLIHSINAAGSAYEVKPIYEHYSKSRPVYAIELPGFGHASRGKRQYTIRMMTDAVHAVVAEIQKAHGDVPIDALALSLGCEFLGRAADETPKAYRSVALVSPTGFDGRAVRWVRGSRAIPWLHTIFEQPLWSEQFFHLLTAKPVIGWFLKKTFGSPNYDKGLLDYDYLTTHQPGAQHAPYYFVSGYLFSQDILRIYQSLKMPAWLSHGVRGDFVDYKRKDTVEGKPNWTVTIFQTGAMPHFEVLEEFCRTYDEFLARAATIPVA
jgi:pimeloyl-ACP methyl ester carboxylesterase